MRYLSVCSGIEAATVAWHPLGWKAAAYSEIEKFPSEVLAHHYPNTPNVGDMTKFKEWKNVSDVDVLVGGTPCQSFSVAGLRKGLDDPRGNLMLTYLAIAAKYRPKWLVWENVPGVLSSNGGLDFASLLRGMGELGYGFAYRVLDAQYFGVAQRRRRVFVIGYLGNWRPAAAVLFERQSLCGYPAPSRKAREDVAPTLAGCANGGGANGPGRDVDSVESLQVTHSHWDGNYPHPTLNRGSGGVGFSNQEIFSQRGAYLAPHATTHRMVAFGEYSDDETASTTKARGYKDATDLVAVSFKENMSTPSWGIDQSQTLQAMNFEAVAQPVTYDFFNITAPVNRQSRAPGDPCHTLARSNAEHAVLVAPSLTASNDPSRSPQSSEVTQQVAACYAAAMQVRRLTPRECERLQGFPDDYTDIKPKGKPTPDGPRYKALGNSMAVPVMAWIGKRIQEVEAINAS